MNYIERNIEKGKAIIRGEGINMTVFKQRVNALLTGREIDEDIWVWLYECYAEGIVHRHETVEEWAKEHFCDFTIRECGYELKPIFKSGK